MYFTICTLFLAISKLASCQYSTGLKLQQQAYPSPSYSQWSPSHYYRAQYPSVYGQRTLSQYYYPQSQYQQYAQPAAPGGILSRFRDRLNSQPVLGGFLSRFREISGPQLGQSSDPAQGGILSRLREGLNSQSGLLSSLTRDSESGLLSGILERLLPQASSSSKGLNERSSLLESGKQAQFLRALEKSRRVYLEAKLRNLKGQLQTSEQASEITEPKWKPYPALSQSTYQALFSPRHLPLSGYTLQRPAYPLLANNQPSTPSEDESSKPQTLSANPKIQTIPEPRPVVEKAEKTAEPSSDEQKPARFTSLSSSPARVLPKGRPEGPDQLLPNTPFVQDSIVLVDPRLKDIIAEKPQSTIEIEQVSASEPQHKPLSETISNTEYQPQPESSFKADYQFEPQAQTGFNTEYKSEPQAQTGFKTDYQPEPILQTEYNVQPYFEPVPLVLESGRAELVPSEDSR